MCSFPGMCGDHPVGDCRLLLCVIDRSGVVEDNGVEPLTSCVQGRRSSQLS